MLLKMCFGVAYLTKKNFYRDVNEWEIEAEDHLHSAVAAAAAVEKGVVKGK